MDLVERVYELTERVPRSEQFGLTSQVRRATVSIASNIAEGHARKTGHFLNHLNTAIGSQAELQTQLELARRLKFADASSIDPILAAGAEVAKMLHRLAASLERVNASREGKTDGAKRSVPLDEMR